jgi:UDP-N-acetylglucosamine diphosphorylase/glucosamine-1-phosphate N-acetyltransferase
MSNQLVVIILAAGEGKRMRSSLPKVLHLLQLKPMLVRVIETTRYLMPSKIVVVTGKHRQLIIETINQWMDSSQLVFIEQPVAIGTGHAVRCCQSEFSMNDRVLILNGDMPLIQPTLLYNFSQNNNNVILTAKIMEPHGYGRIVYDDIGIFSEIIEEKDCTEEQRKITEINSGVYLFSGEFLHSFLPKITNENRQKEYYLTDIVKIAKQKNSNIKTFLINETDNNQIRGVNTPEELEQLFDIT